MKKEKIYNKIIRIIREMYEIQTPVIKDVKEILIKKGYTVNYSGAMSPYSGSYQLSHATGEEHSSGKTFDWKLVDNIPRDEKLLLLAGGLNPDNVRMAIEAVHPNGVDVSSGVENDDGVGKNPEKIHDFVAAIKS